MLLALFADIHANRQAFSACLNLARARGAERIVCLGDYVGYGADPEWTVETVMRLVENGAIAVRGNHDNAVRNPSESMNAEAQAAIEWTRGRLSVPQRRFLSDLPLTAQEDDRLYVHSDASSPPKWRYVRNTPDAARSLVATPARITFCGHVHRPALYSMSATAKMTSFIPTADVPMQLLPGRQWLAVLGAVGQPRDGNPAASFAIFDTVTRANHAIAACLTMSRRRRRGSGKTACRNGWPTALRSEGERMARQSVQPGAVIDGFTIEECVHRGGMATLWSVTRPDIAVPLLMKIPRVSEGEDPAAIVSFEMEQMILPRLSGPHVPACYATGDFARQAYVVMETNPGQNALQPAWRSAARLRRGEGDRRERSPRRLPICIGRMSSITISSRAASCFAPRAKPC